MRVIPLQNQKKISLEEQEKETHSLDLQTRHHAIEQIAQQGHTDASRLLMACYHDCDWRATQLFIVQQLAHCRDSRTQHFLLRCAQKKHDLPLAQTAIWALAEHKTAESSLHLAFLYASGSALLKPTIAAAFALTGSPLLTSSFLQDLSSALLRNDLMLLKPLTTTLGELREPLAGDLIKQVCAKAPDQACAVAGIMAYAKVCRKPERIEELYPFYNKDPYLLQVFLSTLNQCALRSQWGLEDYLTKIARHRNQPVHPLLPLELKAFSANDVKDGLELIATEAGHEALVLALCTWADPAGLELLWNTVNDSDIPLQALDLCEKNLIRYATLTDLSKSVATPPLQNREGVPLPGLALPGKAHEVLSLCQQKIRELHAQTHLAPPPPSSLFAHWASLQPLQGEVPQWDSVDTAEATGDNQLLNVFFMTLEVFSHQEAAVKQHEKWLLRLLPQETNVTPELQRVVARVMRGLADVTLVLPRVTERLCKWLKKQLTAQADTLLPEVLRSFALMAEAHQHKDLSEILLRFMHLSADPHLYFKSLAHQNLRDNEVTACSGLVLNCLRQSSAVGQKEALAFVAKYPFAEAIPLVKNFLSPVQSLTIPALIAARSFKNPDLIESIAPLLEHGSSPVAGRALDALLNYNAPRAVKILLDALNTHFDKPDVAEKIMRCLQIPSQNTEAFIPQVNTIIHKHAAHPQVSALMEYRDKLRRNKDVYSEKVTSEQNDLDEKISKNIPRYPQFDEHTKAALRAAELPFLHANLFAGQTDKSMPVLQFCKALDLLMERAFSHKILMPQLETSPQRFHHILYESNLNGDFCRPQEWLTFFKAGAFFSADTLPAHKMQLIAQGILTGKIFGDMWKVLDGLRAWAATLILFAGMPSATAQSQSDTLLLPAHKRTPALQLAALLNQLQELRNPVAHRQTLLHFAALQDIRTLALQAFQLIGDILC